MANKTLAFLTYEFFFDPAETFQHVFQFEQELATFLKERGMGADFIESINPKDPKRILYIYKNEEIGEMGKEEPKDAPAIPAKKVAAKKPQDIIKKYSNPETYIKEKK